MSAVRPHTGVVLINVGTPDSPEVADVRRYLRQFLGDGRVIDLPWLGRKLLVNGIIVPFRAPKSAKAYKKLWTDQGSPLVVHGLALRDALLSELGDGYTVSLGMRYQNPTLKSALEEVKAAGVERIILAPLFPQYASSSTGSALEEAFGIVRGWNDVPPVTTLPSFYREEGYLASFTERILGRDPGSFDHVLFSFHGLPNEHIRRSHASSRAYIGRAQGADAVAGCPCEVGAYDRHPTCYKMQCHATARALAQRAGLVAGQWSVGFQSRLDQDWLQPFSDKRIEELARTGSKKLLVVSPAFVADCLETVIEIGDEYLELFRAHGGQELKLVESLNASPRWVQALAELLKRA